MVCCLLTLEPSTLYGVSTPDYTSISKLIVVRLYSQNSTIHKEVVERWFK